MNPKKLIPFAVVLVVLAIAVTLFQRPQNKSLREETQLVTLIPQTIKKDSVLKVEIALADKNQLTLVKDHDKWSLPTLFNAAADTAKLETLLDKLSGILGEERSNSAEVLADYQLEEAQATRLNLYTSGGEPAVVLLVGKTLDYQNSFVRLIGQNQVFLVNLNLPAELGLTLADFSKTQMAWADKNILPLSRATVEKIVAKSPEAKYTLLREKLIPPAAPAPASGLAEATPKPHPKIIWKLNSKEITPEELNQRLNPLISLTATEILAPEKAAELGLNNPTHFLEATTESGESKSFAAVKDKTKNVYYIKTPAAAVIYQVEGAAIDQIFKNP